MVDTEIFDVMFKNSTLYEMKNLYLEFLYLQKKTLEKDIRKWERKSMDLLLKYNGTSKIYFDTRCVLNKIYLDKKLVEKRIAFLKDYILI